MLVLVRGGLERLGDVVRCVVGLSPDARVLLRADQIASLPPGSTAVLCLRREDFDWLNVGRPAVLGHRIVLFGDAETALEMERRAVDFCDWISHRIDAPAGPPAFAVRALRNAACHRAPAVIWKDGEIEPVFAEALPGRRLERVSAAQPYADLVAALRPKARTWVVVTELEEAFRVRRVRWASAEAGRFGRTILAWPGVEVSDLATLRAMVTPIERAASRLEAAGIEHGARVAALLGLEPSAIDRAEEMARAGASAADIERGIGELTSVHLLPRDTRVRSLPDWPERIELALGWSDTEVALHWARSWRAEEANNPRATAVLSHVLANRESFDEARALLAEVIREAGPRPDPDTEFEVRRVEAVLLAQEGRRKEALRALEDALRLPDRAHRSSQVFEELRLLRVRLLAGLGRLSDAERALREWPRDAPLVEAEGPARAVATAIVRLARGEADVAIPILQKAFTNLEDRDSGTRDLVAQLLTRALLERSAFEDAERLARRAAEEAERRGRESRYLRHEHASALVGLGRFREAEREFLKVLSRCPRGRDAAVTRHELARCLTAQGRLDEAEAVLDEAMEELRSSPAEEPATRFSMLHQKAQIHHLRGDYKRSAEALINVLREEERTLGKEHPTLVQTLTALGISLIDARQPAVAQPYLRRALRIAERARNDVGLAEVLGSLAAAESMQQLPQAAHTARRALELWSRSGRVPAPAVRAGLVAIEERGSRRPTP